MPVLDDAGLYVELNSQLYRLLRQRDGQFTRRNWQVTSKPQAFTIQPRPDVRPGAIDGEYVITWDDWSKGIAGAHENLPGTLNFTDMLDHSQVGILRQSGDISTYTGLATQEADPARVLIFNNTVFIIAGRRILTLASEVLTVDRDFGTGITATDAIIHNNELVVGFGGSTNKIQKRDTAGTWTTATDATYANYFATPSNRLWRSTATSQVGNIGPTDNPLTLANWSAGITVGEAGTPITGLASQGNRLVVAKEDGLHLGDASADFDNALPGLPRRASNGEGLVTRGADVFYPHATGLLRQNAGRVEEIGLHESLGDVELADATFPAIGPAISAITTAGRDLWVATVPAFYRRDDPTGVLKTTNNGVSYTSYLSEATDNSQASVVLLSALDTLANGDWFLVGYSSAFFGIIVELVAPNLVASTLTTAFWDGAWNTDFGAANGIYMVDRTIDNGATLGVSGTIHMNASVAGWTSTTINGTAAFWLRFSVSAILTTPMRIAEIRVIVDRPRSYLVRGRPTRVGDARNQPIIWETYARHDGHQPTALLVTDRVERGTLPRIIAAGRQDITSAMLAVAPTPAPLDGASGSAIFCKHDGGMPFTNKQFLSLDVEGQRIDSTHTVNLQYRLNEATGWTNLVTASASPSANTLSGVTGYRIQPRVALGALTTDEVTVVNRVSCRFRPLPTYKEEYQMVLEVADGQGSPGGGVLPDAVVQITNLEALRGSTVTMIDPLGVSKTVTVFEVNEVEVFQSDRSIPAMAVSVRAAEV